MGNLSNRSCRPTSIQTPRCKALAGGTVEIGWLSVDECCCLACLVLGPTRVAEARAETWEHGGLRGRLWFLQSENTHNNMSNTYFFLNFVFIKDISHIIPFQKIKRFQKTYNGAPQSDQPSKVNTFCQSYTNLFFLLVLE